MAIPKYATGNDLTEIMNLKYRYGEIIDRLVRDKGVPSGDVITEVFTEDASLDLVEAGLIHAHGHAEIAELFTKRLPSQVKWMWHGFFNPLVSIEGDKATGHWLLQAFSLTPEAPDGPTFATVGRYEEEYVRTAKGWRTCKVKFHLGSTFNTVP